MRHIHALPPSPARPLQAVQLASHLQGSTARLSEKLYDRFVALEASSKTTPTWRWAADVTRQHVMAALVLTTGQTAVNPISNFARCLSSPSIWTYDKKFNRSARGIALYSYLNLRRLLGLYMLALPALFLGTGRVSPLWDRRRLEDILKQDCFVRQPVDPYQYGVLGLPEYYCEKFARGASARQQHVRAAAALGAAILCACLLQAPRLALLTVTYTLDACLAVAGVVLGLTIGLSRIALGLCTGHKPLAAGMTETASSFVNDMIVFNKTTQAYSELLHDRQAALQALYTTAQQIRQQLAEPNYFAQRDAHQQEAFLTRLSAQTRYLTACCCRPPEATTSSPTASPAHHTEPHKVAAYDATRLQHGMLKRRYQLERNMVALLTAFFAHGNTVPLGTVKLLDVFDGVAAIERQLESLHGSDAASPHNLQRGIRQWLLALRLFDEHIFSIWLPGMSQTHLDLLNALKQRHNYVPGNPQAPLLHNTWIRQYVGAKYMRTTASVLTSP